MREWINLIEAYYGTVPVTTDFNERINVDVLENPSRAELMKLLRQEEFGSARALFYPETDTVLVWTASRVEHHLLSAAVDDGTKHYWRLFFDATGISCHDMPDDAANDEQIRDIQASSAIRRLYGPNPQINID